MFDLPDYPNVYTTRHITCVSCKEKFAITEGQKNKKDEEKSFWRILPETPSTVNLHYVDERKQRPVVPAPRHIQRLTTDPTTEDRSSKITPHIINCPRCGADNRNWLKLKQLGGGKSLISQWRTWQQRFPKVQTAVAISLLFSVIALLLIPLFEVSWPKAVFLALVTPIFTLLLIAELSDKWNKLREDNHRAKILPKTSRLESKLWIRSFAWLFIAAVIIPVIIFSGFPAAFQAIVEFLDDPPEAKVVAVAEDITVDFNTQLNESIDDLEGFGQQMGETIEGFPDDDIPELERQKERLSGDLENAAILAAEEINSAGQQTITQIDNQLEEELDILESARKTERTRLADEITANVRFYAVWGAIVGLSLLITTFLVLPDVKKFASRVDANLPSPVFYSVANMTRLVTWEARQALEVGNQHFDIQWMSVNRNDKGGLDLVGLFRDPPEFNVFGQASGGQVRAQKHTIHTDLWCRVTNAKIEDVLVPVPAGAPAGVMPLPMAAQHDAPANVRIRLPER